MTEPEALQLAQEVATFLKKKYGASRVLLFGSRARGNFHPGSNIDIYFEGIPPSQVLQAVGDCLCQWGEEGFDYRPDCFCEPHFHRRILEQGIPL